MMFVIFGTILIFGSAVSFVIGAQAFAAYLSTESLHAWGIMTNGFIVSLIMLIPGVVLFVYGVKKVKPL